MKSFNTLMTGLEGVVMLAESPTANNYHFRFKDGVSHPEVSSATVQSHEKGHDVNFVYKGHHVRASAATKVGNDPSSSSSNGFFRSLHISKGKKFDDKKLVYSHGAGSLKVDKEKVDHDKVKAILPHVRNISEHLIRHSDRELDKHLKASKNTLKEDVVETNDGWEQFGEDTTEPNGASNEQEVMYSKDVSGNYLKMFFQGDSSKASSVLSKLQKDGKIKSYNVIGNMLLVKFRPADSNHNEVVQDLYDAGIKDKGDVRESEIEGVKTPSSDTPAQGEDHVRKPIK
jgi:hypothetical protein